MGLRELLHGESAGSQTWAHERDELIQFPLGYTKRHWLVHTKWNLTLDSSATKGRSKVVADLASPGITWLA